MLDIHAHLFWKSYDADRDVVIERARAAGVTKMICVGTEPEDNPLAIKMAEKYEDVFAAVGIHPHFFNKIEKEFSMINDQFSKLKELAKHPKVVAIGECGLDYFSRDVGKPITGEQKAVQKDGFLAQIEIAQELGLPLIVHTRSSVGSMDAYEDMFHILKASEAKSQKLKAVILHCYQGDTEITKKFLEFENVFFSFTGNTTYPVKKAFVGTKNDLTETVKLVPLERLFVETDCPFLAPQSKRGQRNEPAFVMETAEKIASLKGVSVGELNQRVIENSERVFWSRTNFASFS